MKGPGPKSARPDSIWSKDMRLKEYLGSPFVRDTLAPLLDKSVELRLDRMLPRGELGVSRPGEPLSLSPALFYENLLTPDWADGSGKLPSGGTLRSLMDDVLTHEIAHEAQVQGSASDVMSRVSQEYVRSLKNTGGDRGSDPDWWAKVEIPAQAAEVAMRSLRTREKPAPYMPGAGTMAAWMKKRIGRKP